MTFLPWGRGPLSCWLTDQQQREGRPAGWGQTFHCDLPLGRWAQIETQKREWGRPGSSEPGRELRKEGSGLHKTGARQSGTTCLMLDMGLQQGTSLAFSVFSINKLEIIGQSPYIPVQLCKKLSPWPVLKIKWGNGHDSAIKEKSHMNIWQCLIFSQRPHFPEHFPRWQTVVHGEIIQGPNEEHTRGRHFLHLSLTHTFCLLAFSLYLEQKSNT